MNNYEGFLSRAAAQMQESAIRKMGTILAQGRDIISFAPGYPAPETFPWGELREISAELLAGTDGSVLQYGPTRGYRPLLECIAGIMRSRGVTTSLERLLVTTGSQQGLDLVARVLLDPGDVILVELPTYTGAITAFRNVQAEMVGVRQDDDGVSLEALDAAYVQLQRQKRRVRLLYVVPNFQNPTGLLIGLAKRRALLEWADRRDVLLLEDDPYRELYFEDSASEADVRPMRCDDESGRVIYLSSFSKTLAPGYRVAWIEAPAPLAAKFEMAKQAADLCTGCFDQRVVFEACRRGVLDRQLPKLRAHYQHKRDVMVDALHSAFGSEVTWPAPRGGFFLWAALPPGIDADGMIPRAVEHGVIYVAGEAFFVDGTGQGSDSAVVLGADPGTDRGRRREAGGRRAGRARVSQALRLTAGQGRFTASGGTHNDRTHCLVIPPVTVKMPGGSFSISDRTNAGGIESRLGNVAFPASRPVLPSRPGNSVASPGTVRCGPSSDRTIRGPEGEGILPALRAVHAVQRPQQVVHRDDVDTIGIHRGGTDDPCANLPGPLDRTVSRAQAVELARVGADVDAIAERERLCRRGSDHPRPDLRTCLQRHSDDAPIRHREVQQSAVDGRPFGDRAELPRPHRRAVRGADRAHAGRRREDRPAAPQERRRCELADRRRPDSRAVRRLERVHGLASHDEHPILVGCDRAIGSDVGAPRFAPIGEAIRFYGPVLECDVRALAVRGGRRDRACGERDGPPNRGRELRTGRPRRRRPRLSLAGQRREGGRRGCRGRVDLLRWNGQWANRHLRCCGHPAEREQKSHDSGGEPTRYGGADAEHTL